MDKLNFIKKKNRNIGSYIFWPTLLFFLNFANAYADMDPATRAGSEFQKILFGPLGTSLCAIIIGATFLMAKTGKVSWEKMLFVGFCSVGFLGAPTIVNLFKNIVGS